MGKPFIPIPRALARSFPEKLSVALLPGLDGGSAAQPFPAKPSFFPSAVSSP